mmetsp:Transcript_16843/g.38027  ORF Transcript_16843/g.38027 Transcript_16843/m.38027 type:complete len:339 (-) Transcript_16843:121-1137(-)
MQASVQKRKLELEKEAETEREDLMKRMTSLEQGAQKLAADQKAFEEEKAAMAVASPKDDDIMELNVGGRIFSVNRGTLVCGDSILAAMFSGRWEESMKSDNKGRIFLDFDPDCFATMLHHLRLARLTSEPPCWYSVSSPEGKHKYFMVMLKFFGLVNALEPPCQTLSPHGNWKEYMKTRDGGTAVEVVRPDVFVSALGNQVMDKGVYYWAFEIRKVGEEGNGPLLGIRSTTKPINEGSYGWSSPSLPPKQFQVQVMGGVAKKGLVIYASQIAANCEWNGFQTFDHVNMRLDLDAGELRMKVGRFGHREFVLLVPRDAYQLNIALGPYSHAKLLAASHF